jgi:hypothetical protein
MNISIHFITSLILSISLYRFIGLNSLWILVGGFLIDFDHYIYTIFKLKSFSLKKSYNYHLNRHKRKDYQKDLLHIFHTIEFFVFMILMVLVFSILKIQQLKNMFLFTLLGISLHLILDFAGLIKIKHLDSRAISLIRWIKRH